MDRENVRKMATVATFIATIILVPSMVLVSVLAPDPKIAIAWYAAGIITASIIITFVIPKIYKCIAR